MEWMVIAPAFVVNSRAIALSDKEYKEPMRYWPERFMDENLNNALQGHWGFGPGMPYLQIVSHLRPSSVCRMECGTDEHVDCNGAVDLLL